jgi:hypothetical protein
LLVVFPKQPQYKTAKIPGLTTLYILV